MGIEIIGKLTQKNNGDFKLVDLENVDYDGTGKSAKQELEKKIEEAKNSSTPYDDTKIKTDIQTLKTNAVNLVEDETSMEGIKDNEYPTLTTTDKTLIGSINEVNAQCKDITNKINNTATFTEYEIWEPQVASDEWKTDASGKKLDMSSDQFLARFYDNFVGTSNYGTVQKLA